MKLSRITIFAGHSGSGKSSLAVNYALALRKAHERVILCDIDIVNPLFRSADYADLLKSRDVQLLTLSYANSNIDLPAIPPDIESFFNDKALRTVIDLGGDYGALALRRYKKKLLADDDYSMLLVVNKYRPLTSSVEKILEVKAEIEQASGLPFTGIVNNSNLGVDTTWIDVVSSLSFMEMVCQKTKLPLMLTTVDQNIQTEGENFFPMCIYKKFSWKV